MQRERSEVVSIPCPLEPFLHYDLHILNPLSLYVRICEADALVPDSLRNEVFQ